MDSQKKCASTEDQEEEVDGGKGESMYGVYMSVGMWCGGRVDLFSFQALVTLNDVVIRETWHRW